MTQITVVARISDVPSDAIPIRVDRTTQLGNPFTIKASGGRDLAVAKYKAALWAACQGTENEITPALPLLRNIVRAYVGGAKMALVCHCAPKKCHGDVLAAFIHWAAGATAKSMEARSGKAS